MKKNLNVLHLPTNPCGQPALSCKSLRQNGINAKFFCFKKVHPRFQYEYGPDFYQRFHGTWGRRLELGWRMMTFPILFDVFHYHDACSLLPEHWRKFDAKLVRKLGRKVIVEFWGSDVRNPVFEAKRNKFYVNSYFDDSKRSTDRLKLWAEITNGHVIYADHSISEMLRPFFDNIHIVPQRIDTDFFSPEYPDPSKKIPVIVHAPSQKAFKGSRFVNEAIERLKAKKLQFEYIEVFGLPQKQALELYRKADLIVDQLCSGTHGVFSVEAMSLGKPVICYILPELVAKYPSGFPIINANPETISDVLEEWIQKPAERYERGRESRAYVERVHDLKVVGVQLATAYRKLFDS